MKVITHDDLGVAVLEPKGSLVGGEALEALKEAAQKQLDDGNRRLVIDLSKVDLVNSTGLGTLISLNAAYADKGGRIRLAGLDKRVRNVFLLTRLAEVFDISDTREDALIDFRHQA
jgi:anti-sigma B factor antagonist